MKTFQAVLNDNEEYSTLELPDGVEFTRSPKLTKASVSYSLKQSNDSSVAGAVYFKSVEDAKKTYDLNKNREGVSSIEMLIKNNGEWFKEDGVTPRF